MSREKMIDEVVRKLGHEHRLTIQFCRICESSICTDKDVQVAYQQIMNMWAGIVGM